MIKDHSMWLNWGGLSYNHDDVVAFNQSNKDNDETVLLILRVTCDLSYPLGSQIA